MAGPRSYPAERKAAASSAVLAGIAAADAACCTVLGERSRSQDHRDATRLVRDVAPGGADAAKNWPVCSMSRTPASTASTTYPASD
jgi:hypothetical protein